MWNATRISADAAEKMQVNAGILVKNFNISSPTAPADEDIICETTGDFSITCAPIFEDMFADVNNAPVNTKEGLRINGWNCGLNVTALSVTEETVAASLGAADTSSGQIIPRKLIYDDDFKGYYWIGDMMDENKLFVVSLTDAISKAGLSFTASNNGKGKLALSLTPHASIEDPDTCPMAFYILEKTSA